MTTGRTSRPWPSPSTRPRHEPRRPLHVLAVLFAEPARQHRFLVVGLPIDQEDERHLGREDEPVRGDDREGDDGGEDAPR